MSAAAAADPPTPSPPHIVSVRVTTQKIQEDYEAKNAAAAQARAQARAAAAPAVEEHEEPAVSEAKTEEGRTRNQQAKIAGTTFPPPRIENWLRQGQESPKSKRYNELMAGIRKLRRAVNTTELTPEMEAQGMKLLNDQQRKAANARIELFQKEIDEKSLASHNYRLSDDAAAALAAAIDYLVLQLFDVITSNTVSADHRCSDISYLLNDAKRPVEECGGLPLSKTAVSPFFANLPSVTGYDVRAEDELAEKRAQEGREKTEQARKAKEKYEQDIKTLVEKGHTLDEAEAAVKDARAKSRGKSKTRNAKPEHMFVNYVAHLCRPIIGDKPLHKQYKGMRISHRTKEIISQMVCEFCEGIGRSTSDAISSQTLEGRDVLRILSMMQKIAHRPKEEMDALADVVNLTISRWATYRDHEKVRRAAAQEEKINSMSADELRAFEEKRLRDQADQMARAAAAAEARAAKIASEAESKRVAASAAKKAAADAAASAAPADPADDSSVLGDLNL